MESISAFSWVENFEDLRNLVSSGWIQVRIQLENDLDVIGTKLTAPRLGEV